MIICRGALDEAGKVVLLGSRLLAKEIQVNLLFLLFKKS